jgi:peroxiredoxin
MQSIKLVALSVLAIAACSSPGAPGQDVAQADAPAAATQTGPAIGPAIGAKAPATELVASNGAPVTLASLAGASGSVLVFVRSADWCPFCQKQMQDLNAAAAPLAAKGWTLAAVSYDAPETLAAFTAEKAITYPLLSDPGSRAIKAFNLLNTEMPAGTKYFGVPHPAILFIGADGTVKAVLREDGYKTRPAIDVVIETATGL